MDNEFVGIFRGQSFASARGAVITIVELIPETGYAIVKDLEQQKGVMRLNAIMDGIQSGALVNVDEVVEETGQGESD